MNATKRTDIYMIDPCNIVIESGFNVRQNFDIDSLKESIKANGVLNAVSVIPFKDENGDEKYRLVDGERRVRATLKAIEEGADIARIRANYVSKSKTTEELYIQMAARNEGVPFTDYENGLLYLRFVDMGYSQSEIAQKMNKNQGYVSLCLQLTNLPTPVQEALRTEKISTSTVKSIMETTSDDHKVTELVMETVANAEKKGKKKATQKDIQSEDVKVKADTKALKKGLGVLVDYIQNMNGDASKLNKEKIEFIQNVVDELNGGASVVYIVNKYLA